MKLRGWHDRIALAAGRRTLFVLPYLGIVLAVLALAARIYFDPTGDMSTLAAATFGTMVSLSGLSLSMARVVGHPTLRKTLLIAAANLGAAAILAVPMAVFQFAAHHAVGSKVTVPWFVTYPLLWMTSLTFGGGLLFVARGLHFLARAIDEIYWHDPNDPDTL